MNGVKPQRFSLSRISLMHYYKLIFRSVLFVLAAAFYIINKTNNSNDFLGDIGNAHPILLFVWGAFAVEMFLRFFPSGLESMGCQKQFKKNFIPAKNSTQKVKLQSWKSTFAVAAVWVLFNSVIGLMYFVGIIDEGILLLISLAFSVCDMICILFFCPFQTWFMKNKCCTSCRIYNWDYAMMFTPLIFVKSAYTWSILLCAVALLIRWEIAVRQHPECFCEVSNAALSCANCSEKLCHHKKQLRHFLVTNKNMLQLKGNTLVNGVKDIAGKTAHTLNETSDIRKEIGNSK